jgi:hypothetical protein
VRLGVLRQEVIRLEVLIEKSKALC